MAEGLIIMRVWDCIDETMLEVDGVFDYCKKANTYKSVYISEIGELSGDFKAMLCSNTKDKHGNHICEGDVVKNLDYKDFKYHLVKRSNIYNGVWEYSDN